VRSSCLAIVFVLDASWLILRLTDVLRMFRNWRRYLSEISWVGNMELMILLFETVLLLCLTSTCAQSRPKTLCTILFSCLLSWYYH